MAANVSVKIDVKGLPELQAKLAALGNEFAAKSIISSAYTAMRPVVESAKANIVSDGLVDTGLLHNSISRKKVIYPKDGTVVVLVGVNKGVKGTDKRGNPRVPWRYAPILENKYGFMSKALEQNRDGVVQNFVAALERRIRRHTKG